MQKHIKNVRLNATVTMALPNMMANDLGINGFAIHVISKDTEQFLLTEVKNITMKNVFHLLVVVLVENGRLLLNQVHR